MITSARNPQLKEIRRALAKAELTEDGFCAIEGQHLLDEARRSGLEIVAVFSSAIEPPRDAHAVSSAALASVATTETDPGVIALIRPPRLPAERVFRDPALALILDGVQDPGNAGAILRSAEAFGATGAVFLPGTVSPLNAKLLRASAGSAFRIPTVEGNVNIPVPLFAADAHRGAAPWEIDWTKPSAIAIGSEAHGISDTLSSRARPVRIPTQGVESLNAGVAAAILLYEAAKQRGTV